VILAAYFRSPAVQRRFDRQENDVASRILIVDDEPAVADLIEAVLAGEGYTVAIARDGAQGLLLARDWRPDLILMDVMLPGVDGGTAIKRLKSDPETAEIPIVAMSAGRTIRNQSNELAEADAALAKPFDIDALLAQVEFHLSRRRSEPTA
jgi:DNA-binding response OmpR family regulator